MNLRDHNDTLRGRLQNALRNKGIPLAEIEKRSGISSDWTLKAFSRGGAGGGVRKLSAEFAYRLDEALAALGVGRRQFADADRRRPPKGSISYEEGNELRAAAQRALSKIMADGGSKKEVVRKAGMSDGSLYVFLRAGNGLTAPVAAKLRKALGLPAYHGAALARTEPPDASYSLAERPTLDATATLPARSAAELVESWMEEALSIVLAEAGGAP